MHYMYPAIFFMHFFQPSTDLMFYMRFFPGDSKVFCIKVRIMCDKKDISDEKPSLPGFLRKWCWKRKSANKYCNFTKKFCWRWYYCFFVTHYFEVDFFSFPSLLGPLLWQVFHLHKEYFACQNLNWKWKKLETGFEKYANGNIICL